MNPSSLDTLRALVDDTLTSDEREGMRLEGKREGRYQMNEVISIPWIEIDWSSMHSE